MVRAPGVSGGGCFPPRLSGRRARGCRRGWGVVSGSSGGVPGALVRGPTGRGSGWNTPPPRRAGRACVVPSSCRNLPRRDSLQRKRLPFRVRTCREGGCRNLSHRSSLLRKRLPFRARVVVVVCVSGVRRGGVVTKWWTRASVCIWRVPCPRRCGSSACGGRSVLASVDFVRVGLFCARRHGSSVF